MKKNILLNLIIIAISVTSCSKLNQAEYKFVGEYQYEIVNDSLFNNTYLTEDSFGYLIGDLEIPGVKIRDIEHLDKTKDYIISKDNPIKAAYTNSKKNDSEGSYKTKLKPLDVIKDSTKKTNKIYIYELKSKGKYRLLVG
ncbi:hypothetical protein [Flavobacterium helocola]|uniref:Lipoprotein n=1 Tax=Flavobacterium helocola TaxID=3139139 RepID=A0ABU9I9X0_9FLAO